jgi:hypothetical protein
MTEEAPFDFRRAAGLLATCRKRSVRRKNQRVYEKRNPGTLKAWRAANPERVKEQRRRHWENYIKPRLKTDLAFRLLCNARRYVGQFVKKKSRKIRTGNLLGCTGVFLIEHLASHFSSGMSWDNYGDVWEIDHIRPCDSFELSDPVQLQACFHYSNLQPLTCEANARKKNKWT